MAAARPECTAPLGGANVQNPHRAFLPRGIVRHILGFAYSWRGTLNTKRYGVGVGVVGGKIYAIGGYVVADTVPLDTVEVFDTVCPERGWVSLPQALVRRVHSVLFERPRS